MGMEDEAGALSSELPSALVELSATFVGWPTAEELGRLLEAFRPYLMAIANDEVPSALEPKLAPSDLVQESIVKGYEQFGTFRGESSEELARWLRQILLNHLANVRKAYGREKRNLAREQPVDSAVVNPGAESPSQEALSTEERERLDVALARLSDVYRQVILLRHRDNLSFVEIGRRIQRTDEAVRKLWVRGVRQLQQELGIDESAEFSLAGTRPPE